MRALSLSSAALVPALLALALGSAGCTPDGPPPPRPNVLWVVWDTTRADRLSLYGHERETTPFLERWSREARVFDDALSASSWTVPSHASFFTGLYPSEHGADNGHRRLDERNVTLAELLQDAGYRTYLYSANPHISAADRFDQGFELSEHPWDKRFRAQVLSILGEKTSSEGGELARRVREGGLETWDVKAAGAVARGALLEWLGTVPEGEPWFAFLNYMEAHRPLVPPGELRARFLSPEDVEASHALDRDWDATWSYVFGLREMDADERRVLAGTYDAALLELDLRFEELISSLEAAGRLENTVVILTSDHGDHLGEHHLLEHQFSLYQDLVRVPLIVHAPGRVRAGREAAPVSTLDLFRTVLELTGTPLPEAAGQRGVSLLAPSPERRRFAEFLVPRRPLLERFAREHPQWDPAPWDRTLRALWAGPHKLIWSSDGRHELYDLEADPRELDERRELAGDTTRLLQDLLDAQVSELVVPAGREPVAPLSEERLRQLRGLGYTDGGDE